MTSVLVCSVHNLHARSGAERAAAPSMDQRVACDAGRADARGVGLATVRVQIKRILRSISAGTATGHAPIPCAGQAGGWKTPPTKPLVHPSFISNIDNDYDWIKRGLR